MKYVFLIIFIYSIKTQAQTFEGTIGNHKIFLELDLDYDDNQATAFYFYNSHLKNIPLEGTFNNSELILFEKYSTEKEKKELFTLSIKKNTIIGIWENKGNKLNVKLSKTTKNIDNFKLQKLEFVRDSVIKYGEKQLVWFTEKYSKKNLFRLGNGFSLSQRKFLNQKLDSIHTDYAFIGLECGWADMNIEVELVSEKYISFNEYSSTYCGGAHPNYNILGYNFDLEQKLQLNKLTDLYPNLDHYKLLKKKYKDDERLQSECGYFKDNKELWEYYSWVITKTGITITPSYPHAMTPCEISFSLNFDELESK